MPNPLRTRCESISINVEQKIYIHFYDETEVKLKKKSLFRRLIKHIASAKDINSREIFNLAVNKKNERCPKNQNRKKKWLKPVSFYGVAVL